jgi:hypothetical protein
MVHSSSSAMGEGISKVGVAGVGMKEYWAPWPLLTGRVVSLVVGSTQEHCKKVRRGPGFSGYLPNPGTVFLQI